jgi:hypothetical protein
MNRQAGIVGSGGRFRAREGNGSGPRQHHAELKTREAICPLDDG